MFISVVIPTYDQPNELKRCLFSLFGQDYSRDSYEIIIVDDNSGDQTQRMLKEFAEKRRVLKIIRNKKNKGPYYSRNIGIQHSKGGIVALIDSDCVAPRNWLSRIEKAFQKEVDCIQGAWESRGRWELPVPKEQILNHPVYCVRHGLDTKDLAIRRQVALKYPFIETVRTGGDQELGHRLFDNHVKVEYSSDISVIHFDTRNFWKMIQKGKNWGEGYLLLFRKWGWKGINPKLRYPLFLLVIFYAGGFFYLLAKYRSLHGALSSSIINIFAAIEFKLHFVSADQAIR